MTDKPKDGNYTRANDVKNKSLTPGERAINWSKAIVTAWPVVLALLGGTLYGNSDTVKRWVHGNEPLPEVEGHIPEFTSEADIHPQVRQRFESIITKLAEQDERFDRLEARSSRSDNKLDTRVNKLEALVQ